MDVHVYLIKSTSSTSKAKLIVVLVMEEAKEFCNLDSSNYNTCAEEILEGYINKSISASSGRYTCMFYMIIADPIETSVVVNMKHSVICEKEWMK